MGSDLSLFLVLSVHYTLHRRQFIFLLVFKLVIHAWSYIGILIRQATQ